MNNVKKKPKLIDVYQSEIDKYVKMPVYGKYKYIGNNGGISLTKDKIYYRVLPDTEFRIVDETKEDYLYNESDFELIELYEIDKSLVLTESNRIINYYNEHKCKEKPIKSLKGINSLDDLFKLLLKCYCKKTAYPSCQNEYDSYNDPTYGQCAITAMIVNDYFGGTIHKIKVDGGGTHYFNKINNIYYDLTSDQFTLYNIDISYEPNEEVPREYCGKNPDTKKRYELLLEKIKENSK